MRIQINSVETPLDIVLQTSERYGFDINIVRHNLSIQTKLIIGKFLNEASMEEGVVEVLSAIEELPVLVNYKVDNSNIVVEIMCFNTAVGYGYRYSFDFALLNNEQEYETTNMNSNGNGVIGHQR